VIAVPSLSPAVRQVIAVLVAAAGVQLLLSFRGDSAAHVLGGAALAMFLGGATAPALLRRHSAAAQLVIFTAVLVAAWVGEMTVFGPFDLDDVAFTTGGAFVALAFLPQWAVAARSERARLILAAVALAGAALGYRYLLGLGKA